MQRPIGPSDYYDHLPDPAHRPGDIWSSLPTHGLLRTPTCHGLVITPACDLHNRKVATISYLPIVSVRHYACSSVMFPLVHHELSGQVESAALSPVTEWPDPDIRPTEQQLILIEERLSCALAEALNKKTKQALERALSGVRHVKRMLGGHVGDDDCGDLIRLLGEGRWRDLKQRVVRNAQADTYFLPADRQREEWAGVIRHSVVLLHYPLTAPIELFDAAQDMNLKEWKVCTNALQRMHPIAESFSAERPLKRSRLKSPFIEDLLTRYVGIHVRLGSPDFTKSGLDEVVREIG